MDETWAPGPGVAGLFLTQAIMVALIARGVLSREMAQELLNEAMAMTEDLIAHAGYGPVGNAQLSAGLQDIAYIRRMLRTNPLTRAPD